MGELNTQTEKIVDKKIKTNKHLTYKGIKRMFDFLSSLVAIIVFSPLFLIIFIAIKCDSRGPVIFGHKRLGKHGEIIKVYKFRSMVQNAEEIMRNFTEEQKREFAENFKLENDPRITKVGNFLRKTSLDELPQLFNILIGNMSVVGPRPIVEKELEKYGMYSEKLLSVKPGLTGLWQASGRSDTTYEERVTLDMEYINKRSLWLDLKIIFMTVGAVIKGKGAM